MLVLAIVWMHFICDFLLQNDSMAINKSKSNYWLTVHILAYSAPMCVFGLKYAIVNGILHWITDYISSRMTTKLWLAGKRHWFFVVIGADQAVHMSCLLLTLGLINV